MTKPLVRPPNPHYGKLGGEAQLTRLVERFYAVMDEAPEAERIRMMHPRDLTASKRKLFAFLSGWLGGPPLYAERHGPPRLRASHMPFPIDVAAREAWLFCMRKALEEVVPERAFRDELMTAFFRTADFLRNQGEPHGHHQ